MQTEEDPESTCPGGNPRPHPDPGPFPDPIPHPNPNPDPQPPAPPVPPPDPEPNPDPNPDPEEWHVNLVVMGMDEDHEENPGGFMPVNADFDENNKNESNQLIADNEGPSKIVANDNELRSAVLYISPPEGVTEVNWSISFTSSKIRLWQWIPATTRWVPFTGSFSQTDTAPVTPQFIIEGLVQSEALRDVSITGGAGGVSDTAKLTLVHLDADVDSDNNNGLDNPARTNAEDRLEDLTTEPGKILAVNDGDSDADGIPDFADGYNLYDGDSAGLADVTFVPYILDLSGIAFLEDPRIRFTYTASHPWADTTQTPGGVTRTGDGSPENPYIYTPGPGYLRLWTKNTSERTTSEPVRDGGEYVAPDVDYNLSDFANVEQISTNVYRLWMEAIRPSESLGQHLIQVQLDPDGWPAGGGFEAGAADGVRVTGQKMTVRWAPINTAASVTHLDDNPHLNGGKRIFPDKDSPADTVAHDLVDVEVTITPAPPAGTIVHFQSYDVDDPNDFVPGQPPEQQIDPNDTATAKLGLDNRGMTPGQHGTFFPPTINYRATTPTNAQGVAKALFQVTMQPGDNFRVAVALNGPELDTINDNTVPPNNNPNLPGFNGVVTDMLTVWRRLWIERDSMTGVTPNTVNVTITGITRNVAIAGGLNDIVQISADLPDDEDAFEGGELTITATGLKVPIYLNSDNFFAPHTINVPAAVVPALAFPAAATVTDDDVIPATGTLKLPDGGALLESAYGGAYILPKYVDPGPESLNTVGTVPFARHLEDGNNFVGARNLPASTGAFWSTYLVGAFENFASTDGDADALAPPGLGIPAPSTDNEFDYGASSADTSFIFLETIDDFVRQQNFFTDEWHTVAHEIGHTVGSGDSTHSATGIMRARAPKNETVFDNYYLNKFRNVLIW